VKKVIVMFPEDPEEMVRLREVCSGILEPVFLSPNVDRQTFELEAADAEAVLGAPPASWLEGTAVKWLHLPMAGVNRYLDEPVIRRLVLTNSSGAFGVTIAEHCLAMLLAFSRHLPCYLRQAEQGLWRDSGCEWGLSGRRALVLGTGDLGTQTAIRLKAMGMQVTGICRTNDALRRPYDEIAAIDKLDSLLPLADAVLCCLPATAQTIGLLNRERLESMRDDAILINVGRGNLIDTQALTDLLSCGKFFGVGLDVTDPEPLPKDHPLWHFNNVIITPHVSGIGFGHLEKTQSDVWTIARENLRRWCAGEKLNNVVDLDRGY